MNILSLKPILLFTCILTIVSSAFAQSNTNSDTRLKIRLGFNTTANTHRQLLVTQDSNATPGIDFGYDAVLYDNFENDMFWLIEGQKFVSQGIDVINFNTVLPLGIQTEEGISTILIDELCNVPENYGLLIYDKVTDTHHNIGENPVSIELPAGIYLNRFQLKFIDKNLIEEANENEEDNEDNETTETEETNEEAPEDILTETITTISNAIVIYYANNTKEIIIENESLHKINSLQIFTFSGQLKAQYNTIEIADFVTIQPNNLGPGNYILIANTAIGDIMKKVSIN